MTNREKYKQAFSVLHTSGGEDWDALARKRKPKGKTAARLVLLAAVICLLTVTASADSLRQIFGWGGNLEVRQTDAGSEVCVHTDNLRSPVELREGRLFFVVNGENLDITDRVSQTESFTYEYADEQQVTHYWVVGLNRDTLDSYGYAEYLKTDTWIGGYSARVNSHEDGKTDARWLETWKAENNCPW